MPDDQATKRHDYFHKWITYKFEDTYKAKEMFAFNPPNIIRLVESFEDLWNKLGTQWRKYIAGLMMNPSSTISEDEIVNSKEK
ncbi:hypothetical protein FRB95_014825 [Tulasnella sp. JGI-2019a]|nr:hypothetical protein FRB95_014825 [Tulasnella sp. JGI-2019a]